ncbi:extracellular solute-binding protein [Spirosoma sp. RP8]|uniref:Extracellular solute-binding protein n=1 Tax=Spirosoma liriopis TaxID=2937440 RepID=A0ABT0HK72_9BACT|nr:extracellular solute-binding protein [Spirosoma liriopis]MCK8492569.1 extracellular solute-binding protein [Spirosoma liriopis]
MRSIRKLRQVVRLGLGALLLAGCTQRVDTDRSLTFWCSNNAGEIAFANEFVQRWQQQRPDKPLRYQPIPEGQSSEEIILASVVGKTTPDIYANMWQGSVEMYAKAGVLVPLDTLKGFLEFITARCDSAVIGEITSSDGHIYQVPWKVNPIMLLFNTRLANALNGQKPPYTYAGYLNAGKQIQRDNNGDGYVDQWLGYTEVKAIWYERLFNFYPLYLAASNGAPLIKRDANGRMRAAFDNPYAVGVFRFLQTLYRDNYFARERLSATRDPFMAQRIASQFTGPWTIGFVEKFKDPGFEYGTYTMPVPDTHQGPIYTYGDPKNIVIFNTCRDPQAAWEFVRTLVDKAGDLRLMELTAQFPRRKAIDSDPFFRGFLAQNPRLVPFARQTRYIKGVDNSEVIVEVFDIISQEYEACVIFNKKTPEAAIHDAAEAVNVLLMSE